MSAKKKLTGAEIDYLLNLVREHWPEVYQYEEGITNTPVPLKFDDVYSGQPEPRKPPRQPLDVRRVGWLTRH